MNQIKSMLVTRTLFMVHSQKPDNLKKRVISAFLHTHTRKEKFIVNENRVCIIK